MLLFQLSSEIIRYNCVIEVFLASLCSFDIALSVVWGCLSYDCVSYLPVSLETAEFAYMSMHGVYMYTVLC